MSAAQPKVRITLVDGTVREGRKGQELDKIFYRQKRKGLTMQDVELAEVQEEDGSWRIYGGLKFAGHAGDTA